MTRIAVIGAGAFPAQLGAEFALGGCSVVWFDEDPTRAQQRVEEALRFASTRGLAGPAALERARALSAYAESGAEESERLTLILEAMPDETLESKASALAGLAGAHPEALVASASEVVSINALAQAAGVGERALAVRYGRPPMLSQLVELLAARDTPPRLLDRVSQLLRAIGKRPLTLRREVPGMLSGRLEVAMLRECLWLLEQGVADATEIDTVVRDGLARVWAVAGPLRAAALRDGSSLARLSEALGDSRAAASIDLDRLEEEADDGLRERLEEALAGALREGRARAGRPG